MKQQRNYIAEILEHAERPALFLSFGKDSVLLLKLAQDAGFNGTIYHLGTELTKFAEDFILSHDLTVFSYSPCDRYLIPSGDGFVLVEEYALNGARIPTVTDVVRGANCCHGEFKGWTTSFRFPHDVALYGYRASDESVIGVLAKEIEAGGCRFVAPLYDLSDADVYAQLAEFNVAYEINPPVEFCANCLDALSDWDKAASLNAFHQRFGGQPTERECSMSQAARAA